MKDRIFKIQYKCKTYFYFQVWCSHIRVKMAATDLLSMKLRRLVLRKMAH